VKPYSTKLEVKSLQNADYYFLQVLSKLQGLSSEHHHACEEVLKLQEQLNVITQERDKLSFQLKKTDEGLDLSNYYQVWFFSYLPRDYKEVWNTYTSYIFS